jgi:hypothetical protein
LHGFHKDNVKNPLCKYPDFGYFGKLWICTPADGLKSRPHNGAAVVQIHIHWLQPGGRAAQSVIMGF